MVTPSTNVTTSTYVTTSTEEIDQALANALQFGEGCPARLAEAMRYATLGPGKRLRPQLVLMAAEACGRSAEEGQRSSLLAAACAVEMIHAYSLVHDDLPAMDDDDLRRGRPTCHIEFDEATAMLVGDALQARAFELLATQVKPAEVAATCCGELALAAGAQRLVGGQADDLAGATDGLEGEQALQHLQQIHARKTGALFVASLRLGAIVAAATREQLQSITEFGQSLGLAFQVTDDLLDVSGQVSAVGKRVGKDQQAGKLTYPSLIGVQASRKLAYQLVDEARQAVEPFGDRAAALLELANKVASRDH